MESLKETPQEAKEFEALMNGTAPPDLEPQPQLEPAPQPEPQPEPKVEAQPKPEPEKPVRLVPHQALHEERERRKSLEQRLAQLEKAQQPQPISGKPEEDDLVGTIAWLRAQKEKDDEEREQARQQHAYLQDLGQKVQSRVDAYAAEHPEYKEQVTFLRDFRMRELVEGLGYPPQAAAMQVQNEEIAIGKMAVDQDLDPGEIVAKLASVRGWKAKEPAPEPKPEPKPQAAAEAKIDRIAKGQKAAISPSSAGGGGPEPEMTLEQLLDLNGAAFDAAFAKHGKRLLGG